jgi:hypothetical protein
VSRTAGQSSKPANLDFSIEISARFSSKGRKSHEGRVKLERQARKTLLLLTIGAVLSGIGASAAQAADVIVRPFGCQNGGGSQTVPAGSTITIRQGFSEQTLGILTAFLNAQTTTVSVNGTTVDLSNAWPTPAKTPAGDYLTFIDYPTGITLGAGDSLSIVWVTTLAHVVPEVFNPAAGGPAGKPSFGEGSTTFTCTGTAA